MVGAAVRKPRVPKDKTSYIACSYKLQPCSYHHRSTKVALVFTTWNTPPLDKLNLQSLEYRRLVAGLILTYKIIFGLTDIDLNVYFRLKGHKNPRIRGNLYKIVVNQCRRA